MAKKIKNNVLTSIEISEEVRQNWTKILDVVAKIINVPVALIMKVHERDIEVFTKSDNEENPYERGETAKLDTGLYCETVMDSKRELLVPDALKDPKWDHNPDIELGMISYLGFPLLWPTGQIFGTICVLDDKENAYSDIYRELLGKFRDAVQMHLAIMCNQELLQQEVSERKLIEKELLKSEEKFRDLYENAPNAYFSVGNDSIIRSCNRRAEELIGYTKKELIGRPVFELYADTPDGKAKAGGVFKKFTAGEAINDVELQMQRSDNTNVWISLSVNTILDKDGKIFESRSIVVDITDRKRAEEKEEHLTNVLKAIRNVNQLITKEKNPDRLIKGACENLIETRSYHSAWIALLDENQKLSMYAEAGLGDSFLPMVKQFKLGELTDCAKRTIVQSAVVVNEDPSSSCLDCPLSANYSGKGAFSVKLENEGKVYGIASVSVPRNLVTDAEEQDLFKEVADDIAFALHTIGIEEERNQAEEKLKEYSERLEEMIEELKDAQEELVRKEKLAVLGQLSGGVGHELRNPLGVINNAVYYLKTILTDADETTKEYLDMISSEVQNSEKIVSDLLDFSRIKPSEREETEISEMIDGVRKRHAPPENVKITVDITEDLPPVYVDPRQIGQVLDNLITNAYQAMPEGGELNIESKKVKNKVHILFKDTGSGISKENMKKLFEPLFTTKARGIGMGLSVSKNLAESNSGRIEIESEEGKGSTFTIILPTRGGKS